MASLDLDNSYSEAQGRLSALKTFSEVKGDINKAVQKSQNEQTPNFDLTKFQDQAKELEQKIKKKVQNTFEKLIGFLMSLKGSATDTFKFIMKKLVSAIQFLKSKLPQLMTDVFMKALGCDINQTFGNENQNQPIYIKLSSIDLFNILNEDPTSKVGKLLYEKTQYQSTQITRSTNRGLYDFIQTPNTPNPYQGYTSNNLFTIKYVQTNPTNGDATGWYEVTPTTSPNDKVIKFFGDYYRTISMFEIKTLITNLLEAIFGIVSIKTGAGSVKIDDNTKFSLIVQRILGLCFDDEQEISVSGQAKTAELDDTTDSFFEMSGMDNSIIEERTKQIQNEVITLETCDNVEFPVNADQIIDAVESINFNDDGSNFASGLDQLNSMLANDPKWSAQIPYPQISVSLDFNFIKKIPLAVVSTIISPKVLLPLFIMMKSMGLVVDDSINGLSDFVKKYKKIMIELISKIGAEFVRTLFEEIKKDIQKLVTLIIRLIIKDESGVITSMIERLIGLARLIVNIVQDYRKCKSIIDAILQLLNLASQVGGGIPTPLMLFANLLPGYSPNRAFINTIEEMQKSGLPTGPLPDGSPNLDLQAKFSQMKGMDKEQKINGKTPGAVSLPPPYGNVTTISKSI